MRYLLLVLLAIVSPLAGKEPDRLEAELDALAKASRKAWNVPGCAVAVVKDERVLLLAGHGVRELGKPEQVTPETRFGIGSLTKAVTATALAKLVAAGKVRWDDPVRKHVPYFRLKDELADRDVTLRDLLCHRTGLGRHDLLWSGAPWDLEESVRRLGQLDLDRPFRSGYLYNNLAYITLGFAITSAAGQPWQDYVSQSLFEPLGMTGVVWTRSALRDSPDRSRPHLRVGEKVEPVDWYDDDKQIRASGSVKANVRDLSRWLRFHLAEGSLDGKQIVSRDILRETYRPQVVTPIRPIWERGADTMQASYALGWHVRDHRGVLIREHGGSVPGFRSHIVLAPKQKTGVVVLSNLGDAEMPAALAYRLLDRVLGLEARDWDALFIDQEKRDREAVRKREADWWAACKPGTKPSRDADAYAGYYEHPAYGTASVRHVDAALQLEWGALKVTLDHFHFDTFTLRGYGRFGGEPVVFTLDAAGDVSRLRFAGQEFRRKK